MLSTRREHLLSTPPRHTTQCVLPLMPRYMMCPNQEHQRPQPTTYIIAVVSRTPPANHLQWCLRGTITGTWRLVEGLATCVRPLCAITAVSVDMWLDSVVKGVAPSNATTRDHRLLLDKTAGAVAAVSRIRGVEDPEKSTKVQALGQCSHCRKYERHHLRRHSLPRTSGSSRRARMASSRRRSPPMLVRRVPRTASLLDARAPRRKPTTHRNCQFYPATSVFPDGSWPLPDVIISTCRCGPPTIVNQVSTRRVLCVITKCSCGARPVSAYFCHLCSS
ncbi:hypothetical protein HPB51_020169 [Rhipicephalus microplus]|uniref:Uncharacterized protein n=1 Tax=Rhipicephalus microplus TaxID=6941 RepID=A0A9J6D6Z1_RHIMP|nr:hypothetical protein HPB51_020169 [Rhipicephalus microplus]